MQLDSDGYLLDRAGWTREVAEAIARDESILLSPEHWR